jgi:putative Holliday junction resolvase
MRERGRGEGQGSRAEKQGAPSQPGPLEIGAVPASRVPTVVLGFDYGARRIGVALGNVISRSARALEVLANGERGPDWPRLDSVMREWRPDALLVGLPLTVNDGEQSTSLAARAFADDLRARYGLAVTLIDERHSSQEAAQRFAARRAEGFAKRKHAVELDAVAAEIIVERWLEHA